MFSKLEEYYEQFHLPEEQLLEKIGKNLKHLSIHTPDEWPEDLAQNALSGYSARNLIEIVWHNIWEKLPTLKHWVYAFLVQAETEQEQLRLLLLTLEFLLSVKMLEFQSLELFYPMMASQIISLRYELALEIVENRFDGKFRYDPEVVRYCLRKTVEDETQAADYLYAMGWAKEEIARVLNDEQEGAFFESILVDFEGAIHQYIVTHLPNLFHEMYYRLFMEATCKHANIMNETLNGEDKLTEKDRKGLLDDVQRFIKKGISARLGIKRGGARKLKGFTWNDDAQSNFYSAVASLPTLKSRKKEVSIWQYAIDRLSDEEFDLEVVNEIKKRQVFANVPPELYQEAVKKWRRHLEAESWTNLADDEKPRFFEFRHALHILGYPDKYKFSTLNTHYKKGKALANNGDLQNQH